MKKKMYYINHKDRISKLPEEIIHHILSFLLIKDAIQTSVLSKTWKYVCSSYKIVQSLHFDETLFALELPLSAQSAGQDQEIKDRFMNFVNNRLLTINQQHTPVLELTSNLVVNNADFSHVDRLMNLVRQTKVEELCIFVQTKDFSWYSEIREDACYDFPYLEILVSSKWLQSLTVRGCRLSSTVGNYVIGMYSSLKQLWLSHVFVSNEETISNLAISCPLIELLEFECCTFGMGTLTLSIFHKLKKAYVEGFQYGEIGEVDIRECVNLESFSCTTHLELLFNSDGGSNIRDLRLVDHPLVYGDLTADFPLLEKAKLVIEDIRVDWFKAANYHLRKLEIEFDPRKIYVDCPNLRYFKYRGSGCKKVFIDCPNLRELLYEGDQVPSLLKLNLPTHKCLVKLHFCLSCDLDTSWFIRFKVFMEHIAGQKIYLSIGFDSRFDPWIQSRIQVEFELNEFGARIRPSQQNNVHLKVARQNHLTKQTSAAFVDGLVWSTYPTTLTILGYCTGIIEYLCKKLASKGRDGCCEQFCNKFWWHNIEDFDATSGNKDMKENLASMVMMHNNSTEKSCFTFKWRFDLH
ncbi:uncharacterized protein LOC104884588 isoform X1 [Beta vulgaris subsp. vulgaris]|uniref:uncharacterized protein LOC104884588 isoform X1 n=1 Tax=Beta vulgaris subsp. vulgaris TaxID=3555 RepID=UPI0020375C3D|nr:uncharacterized protein LOC104884588 isoform X1 [Beta vulgaris subsp. vulgaris]